MVVQPFSNQRGGQRRKTLAEAKAFLEKVSGGEVATLLLALLQSRYGQEHLSSIADDLQQAVHNAL